MRLVRQASLSEWSRAVVYHEFCRLRQARVLGLRVMELDVSFGRLSRYIVFRADSCALVVPGELSSACSTVPGCPRCPRLAGTNLR